MHTKIYEGPVGGQLVVEKQVNRKKVSRDFGVGKK